MALKLPARPLLRAVRHRTQFLKHTTPAPILFWQHHRFSLTYALVTAFQPGRNYGVALMTRTASSDGSNQPFFFCNALCLGGTETSISNTRYIIKTVGKY
jgi:hypothetical protein